jgi:high-affinity Fe2+/Pb2+ permease
VKESSAERAQLVLLRSAVAKLRASIMATVFGLAGGASLSVATAWLLIQGGEDVGLHLGLLNNYFPGYTVSWPGVVIGFFYGLLTGALLGWSIAWLYNRISDRRKAPS